MPIGTDYRQAIILALQAQGADQLTIVRDGIRDVQNAMGTLNQMQADGMGAREYIARLGTLSSELKKLEGIEKEITANLSKEVRDRIDAIARQERAEMDAAERRRQADGDAMRARIDSIARGERQAMDAAELQKRIDGEQMRARIDGYVRAERAQEAADRAGQASREKYHSAVIAMAQQEQRGYFGAGTAIAGASGNLGGYATRADAAAASTKNTSYAFLNLAHAVQDAQYGFAAILNNIPLVVQGMGGSAGLAGTIMIVGVAINTVMPHMEEFGKKIGVLRDPLRDATSDVAGLTEKLEALEARPFKVAADFQSIRALRQEIREATRAIAEWEAARNRDGKGLKDAKSSITDAITEAGPGGVQAFEDAMLEVQKKQGTFGAGSELHGQVAWQRNAEAVAQRGIKAMGGEEATLAQPFVLARDYARSQVADLQDKMEQEARDKIARLASLKFGEGSRKTLEDMVASPEGQAALSARGFDLTHVEAGIAGASADRVREAQGVKVRAEEDRRAKQEQAKLDQEVTRRTTEAATSAGPGFDDALQKSLFDAIKGGATPEAAVRGQRGGLVGSLRGRGVDEDIVGDVASKILQKASDSAQNLIEEDQLPKLDVRAERAKAKAGRADSAGAAKAKAAADREANRLLRAEKEAPGLQEKRDVRDLGREAAGRAFNQGVIDMNPGQAEAAGRKALNLIKGGLDPNTALQQVIFDIAQAVQAAHAKAEAQAMGFQNVSQMMRFLSGNQRRVRQRGPTLGMTH